MESKKDIPVQEERASEAACRECGRASITQDTKRNEHGAHREVRQFGNFKETTWRQEVRDKKVVRNLGTTVVWMVDFPASALAASDLPFGCVSPLLIFEKRQLSRPVCWNCPALECFFLFHRGLPFSMRSDRFLHMCKNIHIDIYMYIYSCAPIYIHIYIYAHACIATYRCACLVYATMRL